ncbi:MAG: O-antigen ligase family protein, partial [Bacteroidales bacterium]|nr:O-antigen ligase family protein [Bacteroidales bacterium]
MWLSKETYIEPLTIVKWLLLSLLYIAGRLSRNTKVPVVLITVGVGGVLSYLFGFFFNPSHLGVYASIGVCGTICLLLENDKSLFKKILLASLSILLLIILVLSKSRGAFLALFLALAYLWFSSDKYRGLKPNRKRLICALLSGVVLVGAFLLYRIRTGSADVRLLIWSSSGEAFLKVPLFGYSSGAVQSLYMPWQAEFFQTHELSSFAPLATNHYQTFNEYLHILCEQGLVGFILFALFAVCAFRKCSNRGLVAASI